MDGNDELGGERGKGRDDLELAVYELADATKGSRIHKRG